MVLPPLSPVRDEVHWEGVLRQRSRPPPQFQPPLCRCPAKQQKSSTATRKKDPSPDFPPVSMASYVHLDYMIDRNLIPNAVVVNRHKGHISQILKYHLNSLRAFRHTSHMLCQNWVPSLGFFCKSWIACFVLRSNIVSSYRHHCILLTTHYCNVGVQTNKQTLGLKLAGRLETLSWIRGWTFDITLSVKQRSKEASYEHLNEARVFIILLVVF